MALNLYLKKKKEKKRLFLPSPPKLSEKRVNAVRHPAGAAVHIARPHTGEREVMTVPMTEEEEAEAEAERRRC